MHSKCTAVHRRPLTKTPMASRVHGPSQSTYHTADCCAFLRPVSRVTGACEGRRSSALLSAQVSSNGHVSDISTDSFSPVKWGQSDNIAILMFADHGWPSCSAALPAPAPQPSATMPARQHARGALERWSTRARKHGGGTRCSVLGKGGCSKVRTGT